MEDDREGREEEKEEKSLREESNSCPAESPASDDDVERAASKENIHARDEVLVEAFPAS